MKNSAIYYGVIALGVIALLAGIYYTAVATHPFHTVRAFGGIGVGALLIIAGIVGMVMARPKVLAK